jgi:osmotically-inducible protein OsmY
MFLAAKNESISKFDMHGMFANLGRLAVVSFAVSGLLAFTACGNSDAEEALAQETKKPLGIGSAKKANAELEAAVRAKLDSDPQLKGTQIAVSADVTRNQVTLSGTVPSEALRAKAVELPKSAQSGVVVSNKISVKAQESRSVPSSQKTWHASWWL